MTRAPCNTLTRACRCARADEAPSYDFSPEKQPPLRSEGSCDGPQLGDREDRRPRDTAKVFAGCKRAYANGTSTRGHALLATRGRMRVARAARRVDSTARRSMRAGGRAQRSTRCITPGPRASSLARAGSLASDRHLRCGALVMRRCSGPPKPPRTSVSSPHGDLLQPSGHFVIRPPTGSRHFRRYPRGVDSGVLEPWMRLRLAFEGRDNGAHPC
jgi:hypothetical protein